MPLYLLGFQRFLNWINPSRPVVELVTALQSLLFPPDGEVRIASKDTDLFALVMAEFNKFETEVCQPGCASIADMLQYTSLFV